MSSGNSAVRKSVAAYGTDTIPPKTTGFLNAEAFTQVYGNDSDGGESDGHQLWTAEHEEASRQRRENRERREKPPLVADVPDFNLEDHLAGKTKAPSSGNSWAFWKK